MSPIDVWVLAVAEVPARLRELLDGRPILRTELGKPYVDGGPHFNVSHSADLALIAVCVDTAVGIDLEAPRTLRNPDGLSRRMCSEAELAWIAGQADPHAAILRLWVRKEAVAKAEGSGIVTALSGIEVLGPSVEHPSGRFALRDLDDPRPGWTAAVSWREDPGASASAAAHRPLIRVVS